MGLSPGFRLGSFEILALAGAGGMGEVYKARDTRLDRVVAIKILPPQLASDPQFRERFDREARTISQLDHPNICQLYDVGEQDGTSFLVMQYLEGETLADRLARGAPAFDQALTIATEIGHALDRAHRAGVVHRDLKPGNIFLTKTGAKLLDFGLARTAAPPVGASGSMLPTTPPMTALGTILGTFQYMAPEQIEGEEADARTDIFAFGLVLYEMLAGRPAFTGKTPASLMGAILKDEPAPMSRLQPALPPQIDRVVQRCLAKDPDDRWQSVRDVAAELNWASHASEASPSVASVGIIRRLPWSWLAAVAVVAGIASLATAVVRRGADVISPAPVIRFQIHTRSITGGLPSPVPSPDGRTIAFHAVSNSGVRVLYTRSLDSNAVREFPQVRQAQQIAWSPDSRRLAFATLDRQLRTFDLAAATMQTLCELPSLRSGLAWSSTGDIVFGTPAGPDAGLFRLEPGGTTPRRIVSAAGVGFLFPTFADEGRLVVYLEQREQNRRVCVVDLTGRERGCTPLDTTTIAYSESGHLLFSRDATVLAQRFDPARAALIGEAVAVAEQVSRGPLGNVHFGVTSGPLPALAYFVGETQGSNQQFAWFDRGGKRIADVGDPGPYVGFDLSADGRFIVATDIGTTWVIDIARGVPTRIGETGGGDVVWAPEGRRFARKSPATDEIFEQPAFGGQPRVLAKLTDSQGLEDWSRDGRYLVVGRRQGGERRAVAMPVDGGQPIVMVQGTGLIDEMHFSPDGKWFAYNSDESGRNEVYVAPFPPSGERWRVSTAGGVQGRWRADSRELYFLAVDGTLMAADFAPGTPPEIGKPVVLFKTPIFPLTTWTITRWRQMVASS